MSESFETIFPEIHLALTLIIQSETVILNDLHLNKMEKDYSKLDNPAWYALSETHQAFASGVNNSSVKFYNPNYCPFGGLNATDDYSKYIDEYASLIPNFFIIGTRPQLSDELKIKNELVCLQMIIDHPLETDGKDKITVLTSEHQEELFQLVNLVQPGYFRKQTSSLGNYFGIFKDSKLVAVAGERMKMHGFVEISAIVTHPDHIGKGYAKQLITHVVNAILNEKNVPYLHVVESNAVAIRLYEKLGFTTRRKMSFWNIVK